MEKNVDPWVLLREAAAQLVIREVEGWMQLGLSGDIRALPVHENK